MVWVELLRTNDRDEANRARKYHALGTGLGAWTYNLVTDAPDLCDVQLTYVVIGQVPSTDPRAVSMARRVLEHLASDS